MKCSVFIPTYNRLEGLKKALESLYNQTYKDFEVIIVDSGSTDGTRELVIDYSKRLTTTFVQEKMGLVYIANRALSLAKGDIFIRTDDDVVFSEKWLEEIVKAFNSDKSIGGVTGPTIIPEELIDSRDLIFFNNRLLSSKNFFWKLFAMLYYGIFMEGKPTAVSRFFRSGAFSIGSNYKECLKLQGLQSADHLEACNWAVRRELLKRIGGFDEKFGEIGEYHEPDAAYKIKKLGFRLVFNPSAVLYHCPSKGGIYKARKGAYSRSQNFILFYFRHIKPNTLDKVIRFSLYLGFYNLYWVYKFITTKNISQLGGIIGTITGLIKYVSEIFR